MSIVICNPKSQCRSFRSTRGWDRVDTANIWWRNILESLNLYYCHIECYFRTNCEISERSSLSSTRIVYFKSVSQLMEHLLLYILEVNSSQQVILVHIWYNFCVQSVAKERNVKRECIRKKGKNQCICAKILVRTWFYTENMRIKKLVSAIDIGWKYETRNHITLASFGIHSVVRQRAFSLRV